MDGLSRHEELYLSEEEDRALDALWKEREDNGEFKEDDTTLSIDRHGREHRDKGKGGGQFTGKRVLVREATGFVTGSIATVAGTAAGLYIGGPYAATVLGTTIGTVGAVVGRMIGDVISSVLLSKNRPTRVSVEVHSATIDRAIDKFNINPEPTEEEIESTEDAVQRIGTRDHNRNLAGNSADRRARRKKLMEEFGDGECCPCVYCGLVVGEGTLIQSKMYTTKQGGGYKQSNLVPSCVDCNKRRGNLPFPDAMEKIVKFVRSETADARKPKAP